jgi:hypothetical protein
MKAILIKENSWLAALAARKLRYGHIAIVIGSTIHLHNIDTAGFIRNRRWLIHELKHVEQFEQHGFFRFLWLYLAEYLQNGYY